MTTTPSKTMAALWMAGWLSLMLVMAVAGRETTRELNVFQIMEVRSLIGFTLLLPIIYRAGGFKVVATKRLPQHLGAQRGPLCRAARLVLRTDADRDRPGRRDRIHDADLDRAAGGDVSCPSA